MNAKTMRRCLIAFCVFLIVGPLSILACSSIETTQDGVHKRLIIPFGALGKIAIPMYAGTGDGEKLRGFLDGPVIRLNAQGNWSATWFCEDRTVRLSGASRQLVINCSGKETRYTIADTAVEGAVISMPEKLLILSDIEGNLAFLDTALRHLQVVDEAGGWNYGANRLVIAGDAVDRGRDVFAVLWRLHELSLQARAAGGAVHLVLGNHEQYILRGNFSRAHADHLYGLEQMGGRLPAFAADTVLGKWLREQPVVMQAGKVLITHGGISTAVTRQKFSVAQLNDAMRRYWRGQPATKAELEAVLGGAGVSQYRGYIEALDEQYAKASEAEVAAALAAFDAHVIVVGHTQVDRVSTLYGKRVYAINVNSNHAAQEALLFESGVPKVLAVGAGRNLPADEAPRRIRPLRLLAADDWRALGKAIEASYALSRLPFPY